MYSTAEAKDVAVMKKRILAYLDYIDRVLAYDLPVTASFDATGDHSDRLVKDEIPTRKDYERLLQYHLHQIAFFSHERLIHLIVTALFSILAVGSFFAFFFSAMAGEFQLGLLILFLLFFILLVPYIAHYYLLENGVQKMYRQYDELVKRIRA